MKSYRGMFIFPDALKDDELKTALNRVTAEIEKQGGTVRRTELLGRRSFARTLKKREAGVYARVEFDAEPQSLRVLHDRYRLNEQVFRVQIVAAG